jgi:hypothetical protein
MSGFWSSLFGGSNSNLSGDIGATKQIAGFSQGLGQQNVTQGSNFFSSLLNGDASKTAQVLAPEISSLKTSTNQDQKTAAQNGTRSGGTAAGSAASKDKVHSDITNLTGSLTGSAASNLLSSGQGLLGTALGAYGQNADMSETQMQNWAGSLFGGAITGGAAIGMKALGTAAGGA